MSVPYVCLSACMSVCMYVCMYVCMCKSHEFSCVHSFRMHSLLERGQEVPRSCLCGCLTKSDNAWLRSSCIRACPADGVGKISASDPVQACERWRRQGISLGPSLLSEDCSSGIMPSGDLRGAAAAGIDSADDAGGRPEPFAPVPRHPPSRIQRAGSTHESARLGPQDSMEARTGAHDLRVSQST